MSSKDLAISIRGLSKCYRITHHTTRHSTLAEALLHWARRPWRRTEKETFWALRDVNFDVKHGEVVGLIGRNGAGKSTLLKVLSQITDPTSGVVDLYGSVGSLLEVGTGFHPELTGRENIFLNGAILGMKRRDIARQLDAIVSFAEVEQFLDTPVKRYSSGMYVRLAFAVAAHLNPEILVVREVLAVGDAAFQKKCMGKMGEVAKEGRTVLFVSHNMLSVLRLCNRVILLDKGSIRSDGEPHAVTRDYLRFISETTSWREWPANADAPGDAVVRLRKIRVRDGAGTTTSTVETTDDVAIEMEFDVLKDGFALVPNYHFFNDEGVCLFVAQDLDPHWRGRPRPPGRHVNTLFVPSNFLSEGMVVVTAAVSSLSPDTVHFYARDVVTFQVLEGGGRESARGDFQGHLPGAVRPLLRTANEFVRSGNGSGATHAALAV